jgi:uncharacterized protein YbgA (DUF1722 family)/uncharacterized protein YbbK (DUF523 family)
MGMTRPRVVISKCIEFDSCRWNGLTIRSDAVKILKPFTDFAAVCPEMEIGLGCPRDPVRIVDGASGARLVQPATGRDLTTKMRRWGKTFLGSLGGVDGFLLKERSPSCGTRGVKVYSSADSKSAAGKGPGIFGEAVLATFPDLPVENEGRLRNFSVREHFLTRVYANARFRTVQSAGTMKTLVRFHSENKLLLSAYSQKEMRIMGRLVANHEQRPVSEVIETYGAHLQLALAKTSRTTANVNVLQHALGYFKEELSPVEKAFFLKSLDRYRAGKIPLSVCTSIIRVWIARFGQSYLEPQTYFEPYPEDLVEITDSGIGRPLR